ncbi:MAG: type 1 glutamine amidotransferase [Halopseudomonas sabulinigri]|tara:strand:+ start:14044 stop:14760 length:717 start_codon:yes stop_codon:yes gene_type:complete
MSKRFALLWCSEEERFDYREEMVNAFKTENSDWEVISAFTDLNKIIDNYDGFVVSGSEYSVNEDRDRFSGLFQFIRTAYDQRKPIVGICFGCQALAVALGGVVGLNPSQQFRFGVDEIRFLNDVNGKIGVTETNVKLVESHGECVLECPPGAVLLGNSESTEVEVFSFGSHVIGFQGHPELSRDTVENEFLKVHLEDGNLQEDQVHGFNKELKGYEPPESIRQLIKDVLHKNVDFQNL